MGTYTPFEKLYKVDPDELVNPETSLNYNWRLLDNRVKHLLGWGPSDKASLLEEVHDTGFKFLKRQSNSTWICDVEEQPQQDSIALVNTWTVMPTSILDPAWQLHTDPKFGRLMYYVDADGDTYLRGTIQMVGAAAIPTKTTITIGTLPITPRPNNARYLFQHCGNADGTDYSVNRFFFGTTGLMSIVRSGGTQGSANERYVTLNGLSFPRNVGA